MTKQIHRQYTWQEWIEKATTKPADGFVGRHGDDSWAGGSKTQAVRMATTTGYSDAVPEAEALATAVADTVAAQVNLETFQSAFDVAGSEVDISRFMAGTPECMIEAQPIRIAKAGRAVRLVVSFSYHCGISEAVVRRRGAAVMALVYVLQQLQHPLEVWGSHGTTGGDVRKHDLVQIQRADEPADIGRIMYALAHPTMLRRLCFSVEDHEPANIRKALGIGGSYGRPSDTSEADLQAGGLDDTGTTIIMPQLTDNRGWSVDDSVKWIEEQLEVIFSEDS